MNEDDLERMQETINSHLNDVLDSSNDTIMHVIDIVALMVKVDWLLDSATDDNVRRVLETVKGYIIDGSVAVKVRVD